MTSRPSMAKQSCRCWREKVTWVSVSSACPISLSTKCSATWGRLVVKLSFITCRGGEHSTDRSSLLSGILFQYNNYNNNNNSLHRLKGERQGGGGGGGGDTAWKGDICNVIFYLVSVQQQLQQQQQQNSNNNSSSPDMAGKTAFKVSQYCFLPCFVTTTTATTLLHMKGKTALKVGQYSLLPCSITTIITRTTATTFLHHMTWKVCRYSIPLCFMITTKPITFLHQTMWK